MRVTAELGVRGSQQSFLSGANEFFIPGLGKLASADVHKVAELVGEALQPMLEYAQAIVPVRTGALKSTLRVTLAVDGFVAAAILKAGDETVDYAKYVEAGPHPRPYIRPAYESLVGECEARAITAVSNYLRSLL